MIDHLRREQLLVNVVLLYASDLQKCKRPRIFRAVSIIEGLLNGFIVQTVGGSITYCNGVFLAIYRLSFEGLRLLLIASPSIFNFQAAGEPAPLFALPRIRLFKR